MIAKSNIDKNSVAAYVNEVLGVHGRVCELHDGNINSVFRLSTPCEAYIIKVYTEETMENHYARYEHELKALKRLQGLDTIKVPRLIHYSQETNSIHLPVIITEHINGPCAGSVHKTMKAEDESALFQSTIDCALHLNHISVVADDADLGESDRELITRVFNAAAGASIPNLDQCCDYFEMLCRIAANSKGTELHLVHGDFRLDNIIIQNKNLYLIDWECAHLGDSEEDIAAIIREYLLSAQSTDKLTDILNQIKCCNLPRLIMHIVRRELFETAFLLKTESESFVKCLDRIMKIRYHYTVHGQSICKTLQRSYAVQR